MQSTKPEAGHIENDILALRKEYTHAFDLKKISDDDYKRAKDALKDQLSDETKSRLKADYEEYEGLEPVRRLGRENPVEINTQRTQQLYNRLEEKVVPKIINDYRLPASLWFAHEHYQANKEAYQQDALDNLPEGVETSFGQSGPTESRPIENA